MERNEYLQTPRGMYNRYKWRLARGRTYYAFDEEPKSKNSMKILQRTDFQQKLLGKMKDVGRRAYRSPIIAEMSFDTTALNPPHIHTVVKNYQDLFAKTEDKAIQRNHLIYHDDRIIYGLSVRYHCGNSKPQIRVSFEPFRDFLLNLDLANYILSQSTSYAMEYHGLKELLDEIQGEQRSKRDDSLEKLFNFIDDKKLFVHAFGEKAYDSMLLSHRISAQEDLLNDIGLDIRSLYLFYLPLIMEQKFGKKARASNGQLGNLSVNISDSIASSPIRIQLPNTPLVDGDTEYFKKEVRAAISSYHQIHPIFKPLHIPVKLHILYKPPKGSRQDYNDLDNIMTKIVPAFNEIFKPPSTHISHINLNGITNQKLHDSFRERQERIPKSIRTSVSGYDIFKMPRATGDESEGFLAASFSSGRSSIRSPIFFVHEIIDKWIECFEN